MCTAVYYAVITYAVGGQPFHFYGLKLGQMGVYVRGSILHGRF